MKSASFLQEFHRTYERIKGVGIPGEQTSARLTIGSITSGKVAEVTLELKLKKLSGAK